MKMLMLNVFPRTLLQEKLTLEKKIYSTSLKECFVSKIYSTYKISPEAYIFQRPFLRGLFLEGLIFGGAYVRREICA